MILGLKKNEAYHKATHGGEALPREASGDAVYLILPC